MSEGRELSQFGSEGSSSEKLLTGEVVREDTVWMPGGYPLKTLTNLGLKPSLTA